MERYTKRLDDGQAVMDCQNCPVSWVNEPNSDCTALYCRNRLKDRVAAYEDILGDDYDLDRLSVLVNQRMTMREDVAARMKLVGGIPLDRLRELVRADRDGRCVVLPCNLGDHIYRVVAGYIFEGIFFIEDAPRLGKNVFLTREDAEAALKGEQDG